MEGSYGGAFGLHIVPSPDELQNEIEVLVKACGYGCFGGGRSDTIETHKHSACRRRMAHPDH